MPADARAAAAAEMARVVAPGGVVIVTDSMQRGDRPVGSAASRTAGVFIAPQGPSLRTSAGDGSGRRGGVVGLRERQLEHEGS
eukprot:6746148-Prymnesium_polylepis.1